MLKGADFDSDETMFDSIFIWDTAGETYLRSIGIEPKENLQGILKPMSLLQSARYIRERYVIREDVITLLKQMKKQGIKMCIETATDRY